MTAEVIQYAEQATEHFRGPVAEICARQLIAGGLAIMSPKGGVNDE